MNKLLLILVFALVLPIQTFALPASPALHGTMKVEIFVTSWCPYCKKLEGFLKSNNVQYTRYDIEKDPQGRAKHQRLGGGGIPVTLINNTKVLRGFEPVELYEALGLH